MKFNFYVAAALLVSNLAMAQNPPQAPAAPAAKPAAAVDADPLFADIQRLLDTLVSKVKEVRETQLRLVDQLKKGVGIKITGVAGEGQATLKAPTTWDLSKDGGAPQFELNISEWKRGDSTGQGVLEVLRESARACLDLKDGSEWKEGPFYACMKDGKIVELGKPKSVVAQAPVVAPKPPATPVASPSETRVAPAAAPVVVGPSLPAAQPAAVPVVTPAAPASAQIAASAPAGCPLADVATDLDKAACESRAKDCYELDAIDKICYRPSTAAEIAAKGRVATTAPAAAPAVTPAAAPAVTPAAAPAVTPAAAPAVIPLATVPAGAVSEDLSAVVSAPAVTPAATPDVAKASSAEAAPAAVTPAPAAEVAPVKDSSNFLGQYQLFSSSKQRQPLFFTAPKTYFPPVPVRLQPSATSFKPTFMGPTLPPTTAPAESPLVDSPAAPVEVSAATTAPATPAAPPEVKPAAATEAAQTPKDTPAQTPVKPSAEPLSDEDQKILESTLQPPAGPVPLSDPRTVAGEPVQGEKGCLVDNHVIAKYTDDGKLVTESNGRTEASTPVKADGKPLSLREVGEADMSKLHFVKDGTNTAVGAVHYSVIKTASLTCRGVRGLYRASKRGVTGLGNQFKTDRPVGKGLERGAIFTKNLVLPVGRGLKSAFCNTFGRIGGFFRNDGQRSKIEQALKHISKEDLEAFVSAAIGEGLIKDQEDADKFIRRDVKAVWKITSEAKRKAEGTKCKAATGEESQEYLLEGIYDLAFKKLDVNTAISDVQSAKDEQPARRDAKGVNQAR